MLTTLPQRGDLLVLDSLVHASIHEGARAGRAEFRTFGHNDAQSVEATIRQWRSQGGKGRAWIVAESLYSMDGDFAPLEELAAVADRYDAFLVVDEAHATGVFGQQGRGLRLLMKDATTSSPFIPAARRWGLLARLSSRRGSCATSLSIAAARLFSPPRHRH